MRLLYLNATTLIKCDYSIATTLLKCEYFTQMLLLYSNATTQIDITALLTGIFLEIIILAYYIKENLVPTKSMFCYFLSVTQ